MVESMDHKYTAHGHQRSLSSLASTIMPISDASTMTSLAPSPMEAHHSKTIPLELRIPLPLSHSGSEQDLQEGRVTPHNLHSSQNGPPVEKDAESSTLASDTQDESDHIVQEGSEAKEDVKSPPMPLEDLRGLLREEEYQKYRVNSLRADTKGLMLSNGLNRRLADTVSIAYGNMIDQYKGDDQAGFTGLFEASERLISHCKSMDQKFRKSRDSGAIGPPLDSTPGEEAICPLYELPLEDQDSITVFLDKLRTDLDYLADLICDLSSPELTALTSSYHPAGVDLSVLPNHSHGRTQAYSRDSQMMKLSRRMDNLDRFHHQDPYFNLLFGIFDSSSPVGSSEYSRKTKVWARTCAKVMTEGKLGSDEFVIATIDSFVDTTHWALKPDIELYLLSILAEGYFLLEPPTDSPPEKPGSVEPDHARYAIAVAEFFDKHTRKLFSLLTAASSTEVVPQGVLNFIHCILHQITDAQMRELAKKFIVSRWYFASFLSSLLMYPEVQGMLLNHHIGQNARRNILKELTLRLQSQMFTVLAPSSSFSLVMPEVQDQIFQIIEHFDRPGSAGAPLSSPDGDLHGRDSNPQVLMLSHWDIIGLIEALHPSRGLSQAGPTSSISGEPLSSASSATIHPGSSMTASNEFLSTKRSDAGSLSTDGTAVGDLPQTKWKASRCDIPYSVSPGNHVGFKTSSETKMALSKRISNLHIKLRNLVKRQAASMTNILPKDWVFFQISPSDPGLSLSHGPLCSSSIKLPSAHKSDTHEQDVVETKYRFVKNGLLSLLGSREPLVPMTYSTTSTPPVLNHDLLRESFKAAMEKAFSQHDFLVARQWSRVLEAYSELQGHDCPNAFYETLISDVAVELRMNIQNCALLRTELESAIRSLDLQSWPKIHLENFAKDKNALRTKMWYVSDVRHSSIYEDALRVTKALRTMANPKRAKPTIGLTNWARQRFRGTNPYDRAEKQALEAMCSLKDYGGPSKLGDEQISLTMKWLTKNGVENLCKGEERIHRFCYEMQKSVNKLAGMNILESPVLWSSHLFRGEKATFESRPRQSRFPPAFSLPLSPPTSSYESNTFRSPARSDAPSTFPQSSEPSNKGPMDFLGGLQIASIPQDSMNAIPRYPYPSISTSQAFGHLSPPMTPLSPKISEVFSASVPTRSDSTSQPKRDFVQQLRISLLGLIVSDLGYLLWAQGSETDIWINRIAAQTTDGVVGEKPELNAEAKPVLSMTDPHKMPLEVSDTLPIDTSDELQRFSTKQGLDSMQSGREGDLGSTGFPYTDAYLKLLQAVSLNQHPDIKLGKLYQLQDLAISSLLDQHPMQSLSHQSKRRLDPKDESGNSGRTMPSTKAVNSEHIIARCTERRADTLKYKKSKSPLLQPFLNAESMPEPSTSSDQIVDELLCILRNNTLRPTTLYRDLQYIAAFVPTSILDQTAQGNAFWNVAIAAMALKEELTNSTIQRASEITNYHITSQRSLQASHAPGIPVWLANTSLKDAAQLWVTAAKEGSPLAARELALFYLTHPDFLKRVTAPFSEAKDVFGSLSPYDKTSTGALDPLTFSVVLHWMGIAAAGGDKEAKDFLRDNGVLGVY